MPLIFEIMLVSKLIYPNQFCLLYIRINEIFTHRSFRLLYGLSTAGRGARFKVYLTSEPSHCVTVYVIPELSSTFLTFSFVSAHKNGCKQGFTTEVEANLIFRGYFPLDFSKGASEQQKRQKRWVHNVYIALVFILVYAQPQILGIPTLNYEELILLIKKTLFSKSMCIFYHSVY